jgi:hypothetical protein
VLVINLNIGDVVLENCGDVDLTKSESDRVLEICFFFCRCCCRLHIHGERSVEPGSEDRGQMELTSGKVPFENTLYFSQTAGSNKINAGLADAPQTRSPDSTLT